jgi:hypothetical protein
MIGCRFGGFMVCEKVSVILIFVTEDKCAALLYRYNQPLFCVFFLRLGMSIYVLLNLSSLKFNAFWLAPFCYADPLFLMGISFLIYAFWIFLPAFSGTQQGLNPL